MTTTDAQKLARKPSTLFGKRKGRTKKENDREGDA